MTTLEKFTAFAEIALAGKAKPVAPRFWAKVRQSDNGVCWLWTAAVRAKGYGVMTVNGHPEGAHRISYELNVGPIPEGMHVCHVCDTPACVLPEHLFLGTPGDNVRDAVAKGRLHNGRKNWTVCKRGHPLGAPIPRTRRRCGECNRLRNASRRAPRTGGVS